MVVESSTLPISKELLVYDVQQTLRGNDASVMMFCVVVFVLFLYCCVVFLPDGVVVFSLFCFLPFEGPN